MHPRRSSRSVKRHKAAAAGLHPGGHAARRLGRAGLRLAGLERRLDRRARKDNKRAQSSSESLSPDAAAADFLAGNPTRQSTSAPRSDRILVVVHQMARGLVGRALDAGVGRIMASGTPAGRARRRWRRCGQ
jgi:hypothetical protein